VAAELDDNLIDWLGSSAGGVAALGGKGASLDRLHRLGFRVPPGFCLTIDAFTAQVASVAPPADGSLIEAVATAPLAPAVEDALATAIGRLVAEVAAEGFQPRFAVRSSALGEDSAGASYAGLHETELDVAPVGIPDAVRRCWASLASPAAVAYRRRRGLAPDDAAMAVVVQALVPADAAAVVFTHHPVTGRDDQLVLTAVRGLGDAMVSGTVTPDTYVVDRASRAVVTFDPGADAHGRASGEPALGAHTLNELIELSLAVEARFEHPVDIEAAIAGGTWYLLQARPITTGRPVTA
jgi:pyruvate,water dikinase